MKTAVRKVVTNHGYHFEPQIQPHWSDFEKLIWSAEVTSLESGIDVGVTPSLYWVGEIQQKGFYEVQVGRSSCGPMSFSDAWTFMHGIKSGAQVVRRETQTSNQQGSTT